MFSSDKPWERNILKQNKYFIFTAKALHIVFVNKCVL